jgi:glycosyltransferase involved in cell wall biosynthesis
VNYSASIVVPLRRQVDEWLDASIRSALLQSVSTEVIVVRAEATPPSNIETLERLQRQFPNLSVLLRDTPESFPGAINKGIANAKAERVGFLLSDDWLDKDAVGECLRYDTDIVSTGNVSYFPNGRVDRRASRVPSMDEFEALPTLEMQASYLCYFFLFRRKFMLDAGGLDETLGDYPGIDDFDFIWTLLEKDATVSIARKALYHVRDHDGERLTLRDPGIAAANLVKIIRKHGIPDDEIPDIIKRHVKWYGKPVYQVLNEMDKVESF